MTTTKDTTFKHSGMFKRNNDTLGVVDKEQSIIIRAICCIIVILVHIPKEHGNIIQDSIGSFAYIAVTIFFMLSAYGLKYSVANKENYLNKFWKNRILVLLIPFWIVNAIYVLIKPKESILNNIFAIIGLNSISFITILICYYIIFWFIYKLIENKKVADFILCLMVVLYSILGKVLNLPTGWMVETMGFVYGTLIYYTSAKLKKIKEFKYLMISGISSVVFGILYLKYKEEYMIGTWLLRTILSINLIFLLTIILNNIIIKSKILTYVGNISYEIYLTHFVIINTFVDANINVPSYIWITLVIIATIIGAIIVKYIDSKIIKSVKYKKTEQ